VPILLATIFLSGMGFGLILPGFPFVATKLGASNALATTIIGLYALGQFLATPLWGRLSDRFGRKPLLVASVSGAMLSYLITGLATNLWMLAAGRLLTGLMGGNVAVAMAYVADVTPPELRARNMGYVGGAMSLGFIAGPLLGGLLGGADAAAATLLWPGLVAAGVCFVCVIGALLFLQESLPPEKRAPRRGAEGAAPTGLAAFRQVLSRPLLARLVLVGFLVYFAMALFETVFPFWAGARFAWGPREIGLSFTYLGLLVATTQGVLVGRLVPVFGEGRMLVAGVSSYVIGLLAMTQAPTWPWMMVGITLTSGGGALYLTTVTSLVSKQAGEQERGLVLGTYNSAAWAGRTLGPPVTGSLFDLFGPDTPLYTAALILAPCIAVLLGIVRRAGRGGAGTGVRGARDRP
jgi:DHA1 family tetracycline resistance protein-like MFS transporter